MIIGRPTDTTLGVTKMSKYKYRISYYEEDSGYIYFDAKNLTEAEALLEKVQSGEMDYEELTNAFRKSRNGQSDFDQLEEVE